ncbi:phosphoglycerate dehydrogenase [Limosilactobacillus coleohominis]|uniref:Phosphoglycerate dehydrogenase n=1 Tax=Limosilactobacillus coleohominis TaxID=181675 RepID=A0ABS2H0A2_9LACO|nr:phosphoglycerate dehydrogenase [Limosilactobacillus coleohominis]MBM6940734.1 phosphoglycerate dehydrogenase [Limosilactobacillus coleohominis]
MPKAVLIPQSFTETGRKVFRDADIQMIEVPAVNNDALLHYADQIQGAIVMLDPISNETYPHTPNLKILARVGVGYNNIDPQGAAQHGIWVTITPKANYNSVAEAILGGILLASRDMYQRNQLLINGNWSKGHAPAGHDIAGQSLGIIGYGRIGHALATKAAALGMNILVNNGSHHKEPEIGTAVSLDDLLANSDYVSLSAPVTTETTEMMNRNTFSKMKPTASLINFGRGQLVNHNDLIDALKNNTIHSAVLDAFQQEPLPVNDELLSLPNVFLTPHIGGGTTDAINRGCQDAASEVVRVLSGNQPLWPVNQL